MTILLGSGKMKNKIIGWTIEVEWETGKTERISELPNSVAQVIDDYLTDVEKEHGER